LERILKAYFWKGTLLATRLDPGLVILSGIGNKREVYYFRITFKWLGLPGRRIGKGA